VVMLVLLFLVGVTALDFEGGWIGEASGCTIYKYFYRGTYVAMNLCPSGPSTFAGIFCAGQQLLTVNYAYIATVPPITDAYFVANYSLSDDKTQLHLLEQEGAFEYFLTRVPEQPPDGKYHFQDVNDRGTIDGTIALTNGLFQSYPENGNPAGGVYAYLGIYEPIPGSLTAANISYASVFNPSGGRPQPGDVVSGDFTYYSGGLGGWNLTTPLFNYTTVRNTTESELDGYWLGYPGGGCTQLVNFGRDVYQSMSTCNRTQGSAVQMGASDIKDSVITVEPGLSTALPPGEIFSFAYTMDAQPEVDTFTAFIGTVPLFYWKILDPLPGGIVEITVTGDISTFDRVIFRQAVANATGLNLANVWLQSYSGTSSTITVQLGLVGDYKMMRDPRTAIQELQSTPELDIHSVSGVVILDQPSDEELCKFPWPPKTLVCSAAVGLQPMLTLLGLTLLLLLR